MRRLLVQIWFLAFALFAGASASAQEESKKPEVQKEAPSQSNAVFRPQPRRVCFLCLRNTADTPVNREDPSIFHEDNRRAPSVLVVAPYPEKNEKLFDGFLGRVEDVLRTKRLFRIERERFNVDASYERQYSHGILHHPSQASPVHGSNWRMGIRLKL
ncbi:hypothetical protein C4571_00840 [Candidatus Parcubacteria bacterium]|nr:MAG: hypothetical protein C4571_00840 [Candidatus Parcubacteria bacterium]